VKRRRLARGVAWASVVTLAAGAVPGAAHAQPRTSPASASTTTDSPDLAADVRPDRRSQTLFSGWQSSDDVAWTTVGDGTGFHVLAAAAKDAYQWHTVATLTEPGFDADQWIGNACVTGSGRHLVVVYGPRTFTNKPDLFGRGGFTATVDLHTGAVVKLPIQSTLAYFNPGCGTAENAVVTQVGGDDQSAARTRLTTVDAAAGRLGRSVVVQGELTSAVPTGTGMMAAASGALVSVSSTGQTKPVAAAAGVPFRLHPDGDGGVVFMDHAGTSTRVRRTLLRSGAKATTLADGELGKLGVSAGAAGRVFLTGQPRHSADLPSSVTAINTSPEARLSNTGDLAVTAMTNADGPTNAITGRDPSQPAVVRLDATVVRTGKAATFGAIAAAPPSVAALSGLAPHPKLLARAGGTSQLAAGGDPKNPVEDERYCSVPRNDPANQALQPMPRQVEWAVDQAITNTPFAERPANWKNLGMPAYSPLKLSPRVPLDGGGPKPADTYRVPSQVYLGILAQESNLWQAARFVVPGATGNPLIGNFYGVDLYNKTEADDWDIRWDKADCGYGVGQVTDGMRIAGHPKEGEKVFTPEKQRAVALDFAANIAAGLTILQSKWNQTRADGLVVNDGRPESVENWFYAIWAYNSGYHPKSEMGKNRGAWGVGWGNNPINPHFKPDRLPFLSGSYEDARHPQDWPYQEKVLGFAAYPPTLPDGVDHQIEAYRFAWWPIPGDRLNVKPPLGLFCDASNDCQPGATFPPNDPDVIGEPAGPCGHKNAAGQYDLYCWYHQPAKWKNCPSQCGNEKLRFDPGLPYEEDAVSYPPKCDLGGLPSGALVVDDVPNGTPSVRPGCTPPASQGKFDLTFAKDAQNQYSSKIDFHQIGGGFGGHFWFAHTRSPEALGDRMRVDGTWTLGRSMKGWTRILVHLPDHGAQTRQAMYDIDLGKGFVKRRVLPQRVQENRWVSLGAFPVDGVPRVRLSNESYSRPSGSDGTDSGIGDGSEDVAWDAVAFAPLPGKPKNQIVALGDSYSSGEGASVDKGKDYYKETDFKLKLNVKGSDKVFFQNLCHRSKNAWSRQAVLSDNSTSIGQRADSWDPTMDFQFHACSGAETLNLLPYYTVPTDQRPKTAFGKEGTPHWGELPQLDQGYLDENTTLVTLSIGGNDARFASVIEHCIWGGVGIPRVCQDDTLDGDDVTMGKKTVNLIDHEVKESIKTTLKAIHDKAPNAKIMLMGYPRLLENLGGCIGGIGTEEAPWINEMADRLATRMGEAVAEAKTANPGLVAEFANPNGPSYFAGKAVCGDPETVNGVIKDLTPGESGKLPQWLPEDWNQFGASNQSFHPKIAGAAIYARVMQDTVRGKMGM